jgi:hypothetical protein
MVSFWGAESVFTPFHAFRQDGDALHIVDVFTHLGKANFDRFDLGFGDDVGFEESRRSGAIDEELAVELHRVVVVVDELRAGLDDAATLEHVHQIREPEVDDAWRGEGVTSCSRASSVALDALREILRVDQRVRLRRIENVNRLGFLKVGLHRIAVLVSEKPVTVADEVEMSGREVFQFRADHVRVHAVHFDQPEVDVLNFAGLRVDGRIDIAAIVEKRLLGVDMVAAAGPLDGELIAAGLAELAEHRAAALARGALDDPFGEISRCFNPTKIIARHNTWAMLCADEQVYSYRPDFHWLDVNDKCQNDWTDFRIDIFSC